MESGARSLDSRQKEGGPALIQILGPTRDDSFLFGLASATMTVQKLLAIMGPTASGKTEVAFEVSKILPVEIVSCDSMQIYRGMSIVSQAPRSKVHLTSFLSPSEEYSAARFRKDALSLIDQMAKRKKSPLLVGGTGLYLRALLDGLFESEKGTVPSDEALRKEFLAQQEIHGENYLHEKLERCDPASAKKIHPKDLRRIVRALEVYALTKKPMSEQKANRKGIRGDFDCRIFLLDRDRKELYERINHRVERMMEQGLLEEVKKLDQKKLSITAQMALGVREMKEVLSDRCSLEEAGELLKKRTRNYAKRQLSWFRHEKGVEVLYVPSRETSKETARRIVRRWREPHA
ncbi:MAG: tRNA (adenosine(37)-N6)-dimethylallyltransferase MiaA [Candidatus Omnitrophica bacterium CG07_land_8_20_14_0_80_50_8]|nr:MAG: tRNA (adenosine(37)-N6)-dimethylallyltransferase MiaA [Candidatus Omnitrophica bacterium CG07_land_8_20_14_0_80_50_8]